MTPRRWCECDNPVSGAGTERAERIDCRRCGRPIRCEMCWYDGKDTLATWPVEDYCVCDAHWGDAIDNVDSRGRTPL